MLICGLRLAGSRPTTNGTFTRKTADKPFDPKKLEPLKVCPGWPELALSSLGCVDNLRDCRCRRAVKVMKNCGIRTAMNSKAPCNICTPCSILWGRENTGWQRPVHCTLVSCTAGTACVQKAVLMRRACAGNFREGQLEGTGTVTMANGNVTVGAWVLLSAGWTRKRRADTRN